MIKNDRLLAVWGWVILGAPAWWLLGLNLFVYHISAFIVFFGLVGRLHGQDKGIYVPLTAAILFCLFIVYGFSLVLHAPEAQLSRVIASGYNLSFWLIGAALTVLFSNIFHLTDIPFVYQTIKKIGWITAITAGVFFVYIVMGGKTLIVATPMAGFAGMFGDTALVKRSLNAIFVVFDWFAAEERARFNFIAPYPTATAAMLMIISLLGITAAIHENKKWHLCWLVFVGLNLIGVGMTFSRIAVFAIGFSLFCGVLIGNKNFLLWFSLLLFGSLFSAPWITKLISFFWGLREGSSMIRIELYTYSLKQLAGADWILGLGLKPLEDNFYEFPLGSHSTLVSLVFKSGFIGCFIYLVFQTVLFLRWYHLKRYVMVNREWFVFWRGMGWVIISMALWTITEDLDAPQFLAFLYFSLVGIFEGFRRRVLHERALSPSLA